MILPNHLLPIVLHSHLSSEEDPAIFFTRNFMATVSRGMHADGSCSSTWIYRLTSMLLL